MENQEEKKEEQAAKKNKAVEDEKPKKRLFSLPRKQLFFIFIIGLLIGVILKGRILQQYVIGFEDYKVKQMQSDYDFKLSLVSQTTDDQNNTAAPVQDQPSCN